MSGVRRKESHVLRNVLLTMLFLVVAGAIWFTAAWYLKGDSKTASPPPVGSEQSPKPTEPSRAERVLESMTLDERISQMMIVKNRVTSVYEDEISEYVKASQPGGFIHFAEDIGTYGQLVEYNDGLQKDSKVPMLIGADQEGGIVQRIGNLGDISATEIPDMVELGKTGDAVLARDVGKVIGTELSAVHINMNFAPILDVNSNPNNPVIGVRAFGGDADLVAKMGLAVGEGILDADVTPVYKHFPGHGDTDEDSHYDLPIIEKSKEELMALELVPFISAIKASAEVIMVGHLAVPKIVGDNTPASLSRVMVTDLLKDEMGFKGLVMTDALDMGALDKNYSEAEIILKAIEAGNDVLLMPCDLAGLSEAVEIVKNGIAGGRITEKMIDESVLKILELKDKMGLLSGEYEYEEKDVLGSEEHRAVIDRIYK